jgi:hypothetical protein
MSSTLTDLLRRARTKGLTMESDGTQTLATKPIDQPIDLAA